MSRLNDAQKFVFHFCICCMELRLCSQRGSSVHAHALPTTHNSTPRSCAAPLLPCCPPATPPNRQPVTCHGGCEGSLRDSHHDSTPSCHPPFAHLACTVSGVPHSLTSSLSVRGTDSVHLPVRLYLPPSLRTRITYSTLRATHCVVHRLLPSLPPPHSPSRPLSMPPSEGIPPQSN